MADITKPQKLQRIENSLNTIMLHLKQRLLLGSTAMLWMNMQATATCMLRHEFLWEAHCIQGGHGDGQQSPVQPGIKFLSLSAQPT
jgi:hypothetical protein